MVRSMALLCPLVSCTGSGRDSSAGEGYASVEAAVTARECAAPTAWLGPSASLDGRAGEYSLILVEQPQGADARSARGNLVLYEQEADLRHFTGSGGDAIPGVMAPLFGATDVDVEAVGAVRVGDLSSTDPAAPGVLVIESDTDQGPSILLRFGSDANRRDMVRFDGGFMVLEVRELGDNGFSGTWASGAQGAQTRGHFCSERRSPGTPVPR